MTAWYKYNTETKVYEFNHLSNLDETTDTPKPKKESFKSQRAWKNGAWKRKKCYLKNKTVTFYE